MATPRPAHRSIGTSLGMSPKATTSCCGDVQWPCQLSDSGGLADTQRHDLDQAVIGRIGDIALQTNVFGQRVSHVGTLRTRLADQQLDGGRTQQVLDRHLGVVRVQPRMLVAGRADELRGGGVVCAAPHPFDGQAGAGDDTGGDLGELRRVGRRTACGPTRCGRLTSRRSQRRWRTPPLARTPGHRQPARSSAADDRSRARTGFRSPRPPSPRRGCGR